MALDDTLFFEITSVSRVPVLELADRAAAVLDDAGAFRPDRGGYSERTSVLGEDGLRGLVSRATPRHLRDGAWIVFERRDRGMWGDLRLYDDTRLDTNPRAHTIGFTLPFRRDSAGYAVMEKAVSLLCDLFAAVEGFHGKADTIAMKNRRLALRTAAADEGRMWLPRWDDPAFVIWDRWIEDVWWVNLFGPAYVARWGDAVERMGVRRRMLENGSIVIWSAARPPDPAESETLSGYTHKQSFYAAIGADAFIHESLDIPQPGMLVPTLREHAEAG